MTRQVLLTALLFAMPAVVADAQGIRPSAEARGQPETRQTSQQAAMRDRKGVRARPVAELPTTGVPAGGKDAPAPGGAAGAPPPTSRGPIEMWVFLFNVDGKTVAFEGPVPLTRAEGLAMKARLAGEAPGRYGTGAVVDGRWRGGGYCVFVYQRPRDRTYVVGSGTNSETARESMDGQVKNGKAIIHHEVKCPPVR